MSCVRRKYMNNYFEWTVWGELATYQEVGVIP